MCHTESSRVVRQRDPVRKMNINIAASRRVVSSLTLIGLPSFDRSCSTFAT